MTEISRGPGRPPAPKPVRIVLKRGYWPADASDPLKAGDVAELPAAEARRLVDLGKATVAFPGD
jgi:hypothetical protein